LQVLHPAYGAQGNQGVSCSIIDSAGEDVKKILDFFTGARDELRQVSWPGRDEVTRFTVVTVITVVVMSVFLWVVDSALMYIVKLVMR